LLVDIHRKADLKLLVLRAVKSKGYQTPKLSSTARGGPSLEEGL
jgi:hypothetical protein